MFKRKWLASAVVTVMLSGCAATYESAEEAYQDGDYAEARESWQQLALEGDSRSMYRLYTSTNRPSEDDIDWLKQAADSGLAAAQYDYGMYALKQDKYKDAHTYLTKAAENDLTRASQVLENNKKLFPLWIKAEAGDAQAFKKLGEYYWEKKEYKQSLQWYEQCVNDYTYCSFYMGLAFAKGYGVSQDYKKAIDWYTKSAKDGNKDSARNLAWLYEDGKGTHINKESAFYWMSKAASSGWTVPTAALGRYYLYGIGTEKNTDKAFELLSKVANDNKYAAYNLAGMYFEGNGIKQDYQKSFSWYSKASKSDHAASDYFIAKHYYEGRGRAKNLTQAYKWYLQSAEKGDVDAQFRVGWMLSNGEGVASNSRQAFKWYLKAAEQGDASAQNNLGVMYDHGRGTEKDLYQAYKWYEKSAKQGNDVAQNNLGVMYETGSGTRKSNQLAAFWYAKAAQQNYKKAQSNLNSILNKLRTKTVQIKEAAVYKESNFDSKELLTMSRGEMAYVISSGSKWTEVYVPKNHTIGYINNTHLYQ